MRITSALLLLLLALAMVAALTGRDVRVVDTWGSSLARA